MVGKSFLSYSRGEQLFFTYLVLINLIGFILMGLDKYKAKKEQWRIQELTLMMASLLGGSSGVMIGMIVFKHKINKKKFFVGVPLLYLFNVIVNRVVIYYL